MDDVRTRIRIEDDILERQERHCSEEELANRLMFLLADQFPLHSAAVLAVGRTGKDFSVFAHRGLSGNFIKELYARGGLPVVSAALKGEVFVSGDVPTDDPALRFEHLARSLFAVPCRAQGETLGALIVDSPEPGLFTTTVKDTFRNCARLAALYLEIRNLKGRISRVPDRDAITGFADFKIFHEDLHRELTSARKFGHSVSLVHLKIMNLSRMNGIYGHVASDKVLEEMAGIIRSRLRDVDRVARAGATVFIIMPQMQKDAAADAARRIVEAVRSAIAGKPDVPLAIAAGVGEFPQDGETERVLIPHVEGAVHESMRRGGNTVTVYGD